MTNKKQIPILNNQQLLARIMDLEKRIAALEQILKLQAKASQPKPKNTKLRAP